jgi:alpha-L-fucosidase
MKLLVAIPIWTVCLAVLGAEPPAPYGPVPSPAQLVRQRDEFYGFLHFTVNTFTDKEWGEGDEAESVFNPSDFDPNQIVRVAKEAGMKGLILTCKHHDGFCLWPSQYTAHSVKNSPWKNGEGDVVRAISDACRRHGLKFGVYLSPWDRNNASYGTPEYITYYRNQLRELLTHYGPICEVWFDGANGGSGFYGGKREERHIDNRVYYDWPNTWALVRELQPNAVMFSDIGPDIRWVGNERGIAGDPCWYGFDSSGMAPGNADEKVLNQGLRHGPQWVPAECDVSIRPRWFYHPSEDGRVKTPAQLVDLYYASIGRGASLLLNIPPDRQGRINEADVRSLRGFRRIIDATFARNLAAEADVSASNVRGGDARFSPKNVLKNKGDSYWATDDSVTNAELVFDLGKLVAFNVVRIGEYLPLGQRVDSYGIDQWRDGVWVEFAKGASVGNCRLVREDTIKTTKVRLRVTGAACPALSDFGLFEEKY